MQDLLVFLGALEGEPITACGAPPTSFSGLVAPIGASLEAAYDALGGKPGALDQAGSSNADFSDAPAEVAAATAAIADALVHEDTSLPACGFLK